MRPALIAYARRVPVLREALVLAWRDGRIPTPSGDVRVPVRPDADMTFSMADHTQRKMALGVYEPGEGRLLRRLLREGDTFVDIGAHVGWFACAAAGLVGRTGRVIAVEAFPENARRLVENLAAHPQATVHQVAAGAADGVLKIGQQPGSDSGSVTASPASGAELVEVPVRRIDDLVPGDARVRLLKMDVEGFEEQALRGAASTLRRTDHVLVEVNQPALVANGSSEAAMRRLLTDAGFDAITPLRSRLRPAAEVYNLLAERTGSA